MGKKTKRWTHEETKASLQFYNARKEEFNNSRKKRLGYANILEDMISAGFDSNMTAHHLEVKMQTLLRSYKDAKDNITKTGASPCPPPFMEEMDDIFGDKPIHSKSESLNFGSECLFTESEATTTSSSTSGDTRQMNRAELITLCDSLQIEPLTESQISLLTEEDYLTDVNEPDSNEVASSSSYLEVPFGSESSRPSSSSSFLRDLGASGKSSRQSAPKMPTRRTMTRSDFYKERLKRIDRESEKREEWRKRKIQLMEKLLEKNN